jgi:hypothetical protein
MSADGEAAKAKAGDLAANVFGMTDLEETLAGPAGGAVAERLAARIETLQQQLAAEMAKGLPPEQFHACQHVLQALAAARSFVLMIADARTTRSTGGG